MYIFLNIQKRLHLFWG